MNPDFILQHIKVGSFVKVGFKGRGNGSAFGEFLGAAEGVLAVRWPEAEGGSVQIVPFDCVETVVDGAQAEASYEMASRNDDEPTMRAIARAVERQKNRDEFAAA